MRKVWIFLFPIAGIDCRCIDSPLGEAVFALLSGQGPDDDALVTRRRQENIGSGIQGGGQGYKRDGTLNLEGEKR